MQLTGRQHTAESAAALEVKDSVGKGGDALISVDFGLQQHTGSVKVSDSLLYSICPCPSPGVCISCLLSFGPANPVELQLQRPMAPVSLHQ